MVFGAEITSYSICKEKKTQTQKSKHPRKWRKTIQEGEGVWIMDRNEVVITLLKEITGAEQAELFSKPRLPHCPVPDRSPE